MFTGYLNKNRRYVVLAAIAVIALAALVAFLKASPHRTVGKSSSTQPEQVTTGRLTQYDGNPATFIN